MGVALGLALLGAVVGAASVLTHGRPLGLVLGLIATSAATWALPGGWSLRFAFTTGWVVFLAYALVPRAGGGYLIASDTSGYVLLAFGLVLMLVGIITLRPLRPRQPPTTPTGSDRRSLG